MTKEQLLESLIQKGAVLRMGDAFFAIGHAEFASGNRLFFVTQFPDSQADAHVIQAEAIETPYERDILLRGAAGEVLGYIAEPKDFPEINTDAAAEMNSGWKNFLRDQANAEQFRRFVDGERKDQLE